MKAYIKYCLVYDIITLIVIAGLILLPVILKAKDDNDTTERIEQSNTIANEQLTR